ncbi:MAG: DotG/IcmE/VirB10 family protein, partial [Gammaproteobacteria bacterium]|nr:DotG/IcmE/VirB10 family protein [Gammaproteobacteria bacterium]
APDNSQQTEKIDAQLQRMREQQDKTLSKQEWENRRRDLQQDMSTQAGDLFASWTPVTKQQYVKNEADATAGTGVSGQAGSKANAGTGNGQQQPVDGDIYNPGSIVFAVLDTGINSDEKSPVMATITQGPLKGSKVLGTFKRQDQKVVLSFNVLSVPYLDHSVKFNAYGIDPEIGRIALASSVDNHYLYRYGTLFASSFLSGIGDAVKISNSDTTSTVLGIPVTTYSGGLSGAQATLVALGDVGDKFSDVLEKDFDTPPTVRVKAGSGIGLLLMSDLTVPKG